MAGALSARDFANARQIITEAAQPSPLDNWVYNERESLRRSLRSSTAKDLILILEQSRAPKLSTFAATLSRVERAVENLGESSPKVAEKWAALSPTFASLARVWEKLDQSALQLQALDREDLTGTVTFTQLSNRFANALGLPFDDREPTAPSAPKLYSSGVLKDLPVLSRIPEGVQDLPALKNLLDKLGGQVMYSGPTAYEDFTGELSSLKALARKVADDRLARDTRRVEIDAQRSASIAEQDGMLPRFATLCSDLILTLTAENWAASEK